MRSRLPRPIAYTSPKPRVVRSAVSAPLLSRNALSCAVVPWTNETHFLER